MTSLSENTVVTTSGGLVELGYVERTTSQSITSTNFASASEIFASDLTFVSDGSPVIVEFYCPQVSLGGSYIVLNLSNGGSTDMGQISYSGVSSAVHTQYRYTPSVGVQTLNVRAWVQSGTGQVSGGAGGSGQYPPTFLRVSKVVQASQFIVPLASAPLVTSLPSTGNIDGQEVRYLVHDTNGTIWNLRWRTSANRWEPISGFESDRNRIINGAMLIDQRNNGNSVSISSTGYSADRFLLLANGGGVFSGQRVSNDGPTNISNCSLKLTVSTIDTSIGASDYYLIGQHIEGTMIPDLNFGSSSTPISLSFYVKSNLTGTYGISFRNSAQNRYYTTSYTINAANTWERKIISLTTDNTGTWLTDTNIGLTIFWAISTGYTTSTVNTWNGSIGLGPTNQTNLMATLNNTFQLSGVQFERGPTATPFQTRDIETELGKCQRYFERMGLVSNAAGADYQNYFYNTTKRAAPTSYTWYNTAPSPNGVPNFRDKNYFTLDGRSTVNTGHDLGVSAEIS